MRRGFACGLVFGLGFFGSLLVWISVVGWVAWTILVVMETLYLGLFGAAWAVLARADRKWWVLLAPAAWVTAETLRASVPVVGFPWGELAQSQTVYSWLLQIAQVGGGPTVSFVIVAVNVCVALAWLGGGVRRIAWIGAAALILVSVPVISVVAEGFWSVHYDGYSIRYATVQGNASPGVQREDERARVARHLALTKELSGEELDLVVWPESAVGIDPFQDPEIAQMLREAAQAVNAPMIVGANLEAGDGRYKVVALLVSSEGEIVDVYQKTHLVPFGEYVPWRSALGWIPMLDQVPRDAVAGDQPKIFPVEYRKLAPVISFEGDFGPLVRDRIALGARMLIVATNTSTWERTAASAQHLAMSQVRAAENQVPVIHAALSGISAHIQPDGQAYEVTELYTEDSIVTATRMAGRISLYARTGEWFRIACVFLTLGALVLVRRRASTVAA